MTKKNHALWIVAALSVAVLVPLYGDPRRSPVTHSEWARMMMRSLGFEDNLEYVENAEDIFLTLAWKDQRNLEGAKYKRGTDVKRRGIFVDAAATTGETKGEAAYDIPIVRTGEYNVRLRLKGAPTVPFKVEIRKDGQTDAVSTHEPTGSGDVYTAVDIGWVKMDPGNHTLSVILPPGTSLESVQISPPCLGSIEPENGWRAPALTTSQDLALTMLQALEKEHELAPADDPLEIRAGKFEQLTPVPEQVLAKADDYELRGTARGIHAIVYADIDVAGLYAVSVWTGEGDGQTWLADSCRRAEVCPSGNLTPKWRNLLTSRFSVGRHSFTVLLTNRSMVGRLRLQRLKSEPEDYVAALKRVGFDAGPTGPITREKAREAMEWLKGRWRQKFEQEGFCMIQPPIGRLTGGALAAGGQIVVDGGPPTPVDPPGGGGGEPPTGPPPGTGGPPPLPPPPPPPPTPTPSPSVEPPTPTPTPTVSPTPTPTPTPTPSPTATPTPTPSPTPSRIGGLIGVVFLDLDGNGIQGPNEPGIPNVTVAITDAAGIRVLVITDSSGTYILDDMATGMATVDILEPTLPPGLSQTAGIDATIVEVIPGPTRTNAGFDGYQPPAIPVASGTLNGVVFLDSNGNGIQDAGEPGLPGVSVVVTDSKGLTHLVVTDSHGVWAATDLPPGTATIDVIDATLPQGVKQTAGVDTSTANVVGGVVTFGGSDGYQPPGPNAPVTGSVTGTIFFDADGDGVRDPGEPGMPGVSVVVTSSNGTTFLVTTDANGNYFAPNVPLGAATVDVVEQTLPAGLTQTAGTDPTSVTVSAGPPTNAGVDGYAPAATPTGPTGGVTGRVFFDTNGNGVQDPGESGLQGVVVEITSATGQLYYATTDANGDYTASNVPAGTATVDIVNSTLPPGVRQSAGVDPSTVTVPAGGVGNAGLDGFTLSSAPSNGGLTGTVFIDLDGNGSQGPGENGIPGVSVVVTDASGTPHLAVTNSTGQWTATGLAPGNATVDVVNTTLPSGLTSQTAGTDPNTATVTAGVTSPGGNDGYQPAIVGGATGSVFGHVYQDTNGNGVQDGGEPNLAGVSVIVTTAGGQVFTAVTDAAGNYNVASVPVGNATVDIVNSTLPPGLVQTEGTDPTPVVVPAGPVNAGNDGYQPSTTNGSGGVTGFIFLDSNRNGVQDAGETGIPGVSVVVKAANGQVFVTTTDSTGIYTVTNVPPGTATVDVVNSTLPPNVTQTAGTDPSNVNVVAGPPSNAGIDGYAPPATPAGPTGSLTGVVFFDNNGNGTQDSGEGGIPNVSVEVIAVNGEIFYVTTNATGAYTATGVPAGPATVDVVNSTLPPSLTQTAGVDPNTVAVPAGGVGNAGSDGYRPGVPAGPVGSVTGIVFLDLNSNGTREAGEPGIPGVSVLLTTSAGQVLTSTTDTDGVYNFLNAAAGAGTVDVVNATLPAGLTQTAGIDPSSVTIQANTVTSAGIDGYYAGPPSETTGGVTGTVFLDTNGNGAQDPGEPGLPGVQVNINPASGPPITVTTGPNGVYTVAVVPAGPATIDVVNSTLPPGVNQTAGTDPSTLDVLPGTINDAGIDGYQPPPALGGGTLTGLVFFDLNNDGVQNAGESGIPGVGVAITAANGQTILVITDASGTYMATNVPPGTATVDVVDSTLPPGVTHTIAGTDPSTVVVPSGGSVNAGIDGYRPTTTIPTGPVGSVTGVVFFDHNRNGVQDPNEPGLPGTSVLITAANGQIFSVQTNSIGVYTATNVPPGVATVDVVNATLPPHVTQTAGTDPSTVVVPPGGVGDAGIDGYHFELTVQPPATPVLPAK